MQKRNVQVGIIGAGNAARIHIEALRLIPKANIAGIADYDSKKSALLAEQNGIKHYLSIDNMLKSSEIDAVIIAVIPFAQASIAALAFKNKKHVLCEKPLSLNSNDARRVCKAWKKSHCVGMVNFCYRLIPQILEFKKRLVKKECGIVHYIRLEWILSSRLNPQRIFSWKNQNELGGGILQNYGVHVFDYLFYDLLTPKILSVDKKVFIRRRNEGKKKRKVTGEEIATILFKLSSGTVVSVHLSHVTMPALGYSLTAFGSKGTLRVENLNPQTSAGPFTLSLHRQENTKAEVLSTTNKNESKKISSLFYRVDLRFINAILGNDIKGSPTIEDGLRATLLLERINRIR